MTRKSSKIHISASGKTSHFRILRLPPEVRQMIYRALIGENLIHIRHDKDDVESRPWRHAICRGNGAKISKGQPNDRVIEDWESSHHFCRQKTFYDLNIEEDRDCWHKDRMHLDILHCCRQIYHEANPILWSTNTFSIHDHHTLKHFLLGRSISQKSYMRSIRLRFDLTQRPFLHIRREILTPEVMHSFPGLEKLHLILEDDIPPRLALIMAMTGKSLVDFGGNRIDPGLESLSLLPLKEVFVEVFTPDILESDENCYTKSWRKEYADMVQCFLLNGRT